MNKYAILKYFKYDHLPQDLRDVSKHLAAAAHMLASILPDCEETEVGLRKLLEAKDCFVRAALQARDS